MFIKSDPKIKIYKLMVIPILFKTRGKNIFLPTLLIYRIGFTLQCTADMDLLKMVPVEILLNFRNYFHTLQLGF